MRAVFLALLLVPGLALAQEGTLPDWADKSGAIGVGGNTTLGGSHGLVFRTYFNPHLGLQLTFGYGLESTTVETDAGAGDTSVSATHLDVGLYGSYKLAYWQRGHLSGLLGVDLVKLSTSVDTPAGDYDDSATDFLLGLGMMGEYFPTQYLSLNVGVGMTADFLPQDDLSVQTTDDTTDFSGIDMNLGGDLWGSAGFTVWFN